MIYNYTLDYYADRFTGTLTEYTETISNKNGTYFSEITFHVIISRSNIIVEFSSFLILPLFMIATLLAVIVYRRRISE